MAPRKKAEPKKEEEYPALNSLKVPINDLRWVLADLMKEGHTQYPLGDLLFLIRDLIRKKKDEE